MKNAMFHSDIIETSRVIYTPSEFARLSLFHIQEIGTLHAENKHVSKRDKLSSYLFFVVHFGSGKLTYDGIEYELNPGDCVFIDCKKNYSHETSDDLWMLSWIHFDGPSLAMIYQKYKERGGQPAFHPTNSDEYVHILQRLKRIIASETYVKDMQINENLSKILTLLMEDSWNVETHSNYTKHYDIYEIKKYLDENYTQKITLDEISERYYINKFYLTRVFKEQFGTSINNYLLSLRITQAKSELRFTNKSIEQVGLDAGIGSGNYFSRTFTKFEGISPSEYRNQWRGGQ